MAYLHSSMVVADIVADIRVVWRQIKESTPNGSCLREAARRLSDLFESKLSRLVDVEGRVERRQAQAI